MYVRANAVPHFASSVPSGCATGVATLGERERERWPRPPTCRQVRADEGRECYIHIPPRGEAFLLFLPCWLIKSTHAVPTQRVLRLFWGGHGAHYRR